MVVTVTVAGAEGVGVAVHSGNAGEDLQPLLLPAAAAAAAAAVKFVLGRTIDPGSGWGELYL